MSTWGGVFRRVHGGQPRADLGSWCTFICEDTLTFVKQKDLEQEDAGERESLWLAGGRLQIAAQLGHQSCSVGGIRAWNTHTFHHVDTREHHRRCLTSKRKIGPLMGAASSRSLDPQAELYQNQKVSTALMSRKQVLSYSFYSALDVSRGRRATGAAQKVPESAPSGSISAGGWC